MSELCLFCERPATHYCDAVIGKVLDVEASKTNSYPVTTMEAMLSVSYTCDAPFCADHGKKVGHVCGRNPDTIDHCMLHAERGEGKTPLLHPDEIAKQRRALHAEWKRKRIREDMTLREQVSYWRERALTSEECVESRQPLPTDRSAG